MSKEYLEALEHIYYGSQGYGETDKYYKYLKEYLESIENVNPNETLETLKDMLIGNSINDSINDYVDNLILPIKQALQRLESIDNTKPNEALEILYNDAKLDRDRIEKGGIVTYAEEIEYNESIKPYYDTIKNYILKAQEQEKVLEILKNKLDFVFFGRTREVKIEQVDVESDVYVMNETGDTLLPDDEFDLLKRWLG